MMLRQLLPLGFLFSLVAHSCSQGPTEIPHLVDAPRPDTTVLRVDSVLIHADDWYFSGETGEIFLLRSDSLFSSPAKPLRWQFRGANAAWQDMHIFRVYRAGAGSIAVLFTYSDDEKETGKAPLWWFSGGKTEQFSPALPRDGHRWVLLPQPVLPDNRGLFLYLRQESIDRKNRNIPFDSTAIYWLDLQEHSLTRLPFVQIPEFYDTTMRYAYFLTGHRYYPEEEQAFSTFHRFDTYMGAVAPDVADPRLTSPWNLFRCDPWDDRPCLVERWGRKPSGKGSFEPRLKGFYAPNGHFIPFDMTWAKVWHAEVADSLPLETGIDRLSTAHNNLVFSVGGAVYLASETTQLRPVRLCSSSLSFGVFQNGAGLIHHERGAPMYSDNFRPGALFLYDPSGRTQMDIFKRLRRKPDNPAFEDRETISLEAFMDVAGFSPAPLQLIRIWQAFIPPPGKWTAPALLPQKKETGHQIEDYTSDSHTLSAFGTPPRYVNGLERYAFLHQDGRLTFAGLGFLGADWADFQTLLFHPSGAILARDWNSGNLRWWGFEIPK